jgi:osmotically inducible protein OsmC
MEGRGVGTTPEELLVSAVSSCYGATLFAVVRRARLPVDLLKVDARGVVTGFPRPFPLSHG